MTTRLIAESGQEISVAKDELAGAAAGRDKSATYGYTKVIPLRDVPPGTYLLRLEAQRRDDLDRTAVREASVTVVSN